MDFINTFYGINFVNPDLSHFLFILISDISFDVFLSISLILTFYFSPSLPHNFYEVDPFLSKMSIFS